MHARLLALALLVSQVPPVVLPCVTSDTTVVCYCKQGVAQACATLAAQDEETLKGILRAAAMVKAAKEANKAQEKAGDSVDTGCGGDGQDPKDEDDQKKCTGQWHHIISMTVWKALELHRVLKGHYTYRDSHFVTQAKDLKAHCGYQKWHKQVDEEIAKWIARHGEATMQQFEVYLREVYSRPAL